MVSELSTKLWGQGSRQKRNRAAGKAQQQQTYNRITARSQGIDNPFTLELDYNFKVEQSDGSGNYAGASGAYFDPTNLPGWAYLKTLFKEYRLVYYAVSFKKILGDDSNGMLSFRKSSDPAETVLANFDQEVEYGAKEVTMKELEEGIIIPVVPKTTEQAEWHQIDETTDANNFGYAKEFGQVFARGGYLPASSYFMTFHEHCRVVFRGYKN